MRPPSAPGQQARQTQYLPSQSSVQLFTIYLPFIYQLFYCINFLIVKNVRINNFMRNDKNPPPRRGPHTTPTHRPRPPASSGAGRGAVTPGSAP